jgi:hypothetical protein
MPAAGLIAKIARSLSAIGSFECTAPKSSASAFGCEETWPYIWIRQLALSLSELTGVRIGENPQVSLRWT